MARWLPRRDDQPHGFFLKSFQKRREEILLKECNLTAMADLSYGVLDTAMVETAAYGMQKENEAH